MIEALLELLSWACVLSGAFFTLVGGIGILRMPDLFSRLHASGVADMLGAGLLLVGLMLQADSFWTVAKIGILLGFFALTSPTAAHVVAKCALHTGVQPMTGEGPFRASRPADREGASSKL
ncbi:MAG: monovalent cation/H(+) antiporter subunit G [Planctomycetota bacterium]|nr:monovalent cation/H(+) antiporter subunit G [Planctomycetota bacterium]